MPLTRPALPALLACALSALPTAALALSPLPAQRIADAEAAAVLGQAYAETVRLDPAGWPGRAAPGQAPVRRRICEDSGPERYGARSLAVCNSDGSADLWILQDGRGSQGRARVWASQRGLRTSGERPVERLRVGSGREAFLVRGSAPERNGRHNLSLWYAEYFGEFERLLAIGTRAGQGAAALECRLRLDESQYERGYYGLVVEVRDGKGAVRDLPVPYHHGRYRVPEADLQRYGCDRPVSSSD